MKKSKILIVFVVSGAVLFSLAWLFLFKTQAGGKFLIRFTTGRPMSQAQVESRIDDVYHLLQKQAPDSEMAWPEFDLAKHNIIAIQIDDKSGRAIKGWCLNSQSKKKLTAKETASIKAPSIGGYAYQEFDGRDSIVLSFSKTMLPYLDSGSNVNYLYEVATHELYHHYYDPIEKYQQLGGMAEERFTAFPKDAVPRVYRKLVYDNLVSAYENTREEQQFLGRAKYWYEIWKAKYPREYEQSVFVDIAEGKARYIQNIMCVDLKSSSDIRSDIQKLMIIDDKPFESLDVESYELGFLAGVIMDGRRPGWKKEISRNPAPPAELLLEDVKTVKEDEKAFHAMLKKAKKENEKANAVTKTKLKDIDLAERKTDTPYLALDNKFLTGSYSTSDFIGYQGKTISLDFTAEFESGKHRMKLSAVSVYQTDGESSSYLLPLTMNYTIDGNFITLKGPKAGGRVKVRETHNDEGRLIYVME